MKRILFSLILAGVACISNASETVLWLRDAQISPDGKQIAFCYKGDIYKVATEGGTATRLTTLSSYEANPLWSPDGKTIAFSSDRHGNLDVYVMSADGGSAKRLTYNTASEIPTAFTPDGKSVLYNASIQNPAQSMMFDHRSQTEVYSVAISGGRPVQILGTPAEAICFTPDGKQMLYQDRKGGEDEFRKHHTSSITRDIWLYDLKTKRHTNLTNRAGEDRNPVLSVDGKTVYFLSERNGGSFNVYKAAFGSTLSKDVVAVTNYKGNKVNVNNAWDHPVRFLSIARNNTLCYTYDGEIYTMKPGAAAQKVKISIIRDDDDVIADLTPRGAQQASVSTDGKQIAFVSRGEVFVTTTDYATTRQITHTAAAEAAPSFSPDGRSLVYCSYRDGHWQLYRATIARKEDPNFANAMTFKEEIIAKSDVDRAYPEYSPDGKEIAFIENRNKLMVMNVASGKVRQVTDGTQWMSRSGGFSYSWSPNGKWFALTFTGNKRDPYYDIGIVSAQGGKITNVTQSAYASSSPQWVLDGNAILFANERYGMRSHASWGSQEDAFLVFVNQDAYDKFNLSEEDYKLLKEVKAANSSIQIDSQPSAITCPVQIDSQPSASTCPVQIDIVDLQSPTKKGKKATAKKADDKAASDTTKTKKPAVKAIAMELDGIQERIVRITPNSSDLGAGMLSKDGETFYFITRSLGKGSELWSVKLRKKESKMLQALTGGGSMQMDKDGNIYILGSEMKKMDGKTGKIEPITFSTSMKLNLYDEREFLLQYVRHEVGERFYNKNMHGVKWDALVDHYAKFLPHIANNYDFQELLSELLGELNVSHTGSRYYRPAVKGDAVASQLGLLYDLTYTGKGFKVSEVVKGGPFDRKASKMCAGAIITAIDGEEITADMDIVQLLDGKARQKTLVSFTSNGKSNEEVVLPITNSQLATLLYDRWVKRCEHIVDSVSGGRLGYVHLESMNDASFRTIYSDMLGKYNLRDGIVIDTRWNGGGRLHEDIEIMTSGEKYLTQVVRGVESCDMPSRRYNKPTIMLQCEANYSNAHGTPWVYKHKNIGKLVGAPVPGTMTSVNWVTTQDSSLIFGIPVIGYLQEDGKTYLENSQLEPDILILNAPEDIVRGIDQQLITATKELLKQLNHQTTKPLNHH